MKSVAVFCSSSLSFISQALFRERERERQRNREREGEGNKGEKGGEGKRPGVEKMEE